MNISIAWVLGGIIGVVLFFVIERFISRSFTKKESLKEDLESWAKVTDESSRHRSKKADKVSVYEVGTHSERRFTGIPSIDFKRTPTGL